MKKFLIKILIILSMIFVLKVSPALATTYSYDDLGRLTSVTYDSGQTSTYSYDSTGNMLSITNSTGNKLITSYGLPTQTVPAVIDTTNNTVAVAVYDGTDVTNLVATFALSDGATAQVGDTVQVSGVTATDFTNPVVYKVTAVDGSEQNWTVTVFTAASISETLTVSNPSTTGFIVALNPALAGLAGSDFTLLDGTTPVAINSVSTTDNGATYTIAAMLISGKTYTVTATKTGYTFGTAQNLVVPVAPISKTLTVSNPSTTGFIVALSLALDGLTAGDFTLVDSSNNPISIIGAVTTDNGATYVISASLSAGQTYMTTAMKSGYDFGTAQNVVVPPAVATVSSADVLDSTHIVLTMSSALIGSLGDPAAFTISGVASNPTVTNVTITDTMVTLTLSSAVVNSDSSVTVSYAKTGIDDLSNGTLVADFSNLSVANNLP